MATGMAVHPKVAPAIDAVRQIASHQLPSRRAQEELWHLFQSVPALLIAMGKIRSRTAGILARSFVASRATNDLNDTARNYAGVASAGHALFQRYCAAHKDLLDRIFNPRPDEANTDI